MSNSNVTLCEVPPPKVEHEEGNRPEDAGNELAPAVFHVVPSQVKEDVFRAVRPVDLAAMVGNLTLMALSGMEETLNLGRLFFWDKNPDSFWYWSHKF